MNMETVAPSTPPQDWTQNNSTEVYTQKGSIGRPSFKTINPVWAKSIRPLTYCFCTAPVNPSTGCLQCIHKKCCRREHPIYPQSAVGAWVYARVSDSEAPQLPSACHFTWGHCKGKEVCTLLTNCKRYSRKALFLWLGLRAKAGIPLCYSSCKMRTEVTAVWCPHILQIVLNPPKKEVRQPAE
jgi:hypothetical protein